MRIRSFKLRSTDGKDPHVRIVPATDEAGCPFEGPGVDLRGEAAARVFARAEPLFDAIRAFEPGIVIRTLSFDLDRPRLLATLEPTTPEADPRPRVVRLDQGPALSALAPLGLALAEELVEEARVMLAARAAREENGVG